MIMFYVLNVMHKSSHFDQITSVFFLFIEIMCLKLCASVTYKMYTYVQIRFQYLHGFLLLNIYIFHYKCNLCLWNCQLDHKYVHSVPFHGHFLIVKCNKRETKTGISMYIWMLLPRSLIRYFEEPGEGISVGMSYAVGLFAVSMTRTVLENQIDLQNNHLQFQFKTVLMSSIYRKVNYRRCLLIYLLISWLFQCDG